RSSESTSRGQVRRRRHSGGVIDHTEASQLRWTSWPYEGGGTKGEYRKRTVPVDSFEAKQWVSEMSTATSGSGRRPVGTKVSLATLAMGARTTGPCLKRVARGGSWASTLGTSALPSGAGGRGASTWASGWKILDLVLKFHPL